MSSPSLDSAGAFGRWFTDEFGLPACEYTCDQAVDARAETFTTCGPDRLHWAQFGSLRLNAMAANRGDVQVIESSRGLQWLNRFDPARFCPGGGIGVLKSGANSATDLYSPDKFRAGLRRVFGTFYFRKTFHADGFDVDHMIIAPCEDAAALVCELTIVNTSAERRAVDAMEFFGVNYWFMGLEMIVMPSGRRSYGPSPVENAAAAALKQVRTLTGTDSDAMRRRFSDKFGFEHRFNADVGTLVQTPVWRGGRRPDRDSRASKNYWPDSVFLAALNFTPDIVVGDVGEMLSAAPALFADAGVTGNKGAAGRPCLCLGKKLDLAPGESARLLLLYGYAPESEAAPAAARCAEKYRDARAAEVEGAKWGRRVAVFDAGGAAGTEWVERETRWHSAHTLGAALRDDYFENHYLPQGGAYEYLHGFRGAVRDFAFFTVALVYLAPELAREMLEFCMRLQTRSGRIMYASYNYGQAGGAIVHTHPSDLQLFLLWALTEYVFFTGDYAFLDKEIPFYPKESGAATVRERVLLSIDYIFERIGAGAHGLLRVGDGDWSDGISLFALDRGAFTKKGESSFTTAMALYALPRAASLIGDTHPDKAAELTRRTGQLRDAVLSAWNGRWFFRGYDGLGNPIGDDTLFLEHHTWLLISGALPDDMARTVMENIRRILDEPSPFGQMILYPPARTRFNIYEKGWDVNGGVWYAMNFLLSWGYSMYDPALGWAAFRKNSLARRAETHPDIWYGLWTGPDAYNAHHAPRPGETYYHLPTPMTDFPAMNLNLHANFLLALIKLCGIEPSREGLSVRPRIPLERFRLRTPVIDVEVNGGEARVSFLGKTKM